MPDLSARLKDVYHPIITGLREMPKPVVAAVNGPAVGIGCSLALAADLIVAAESAYFLLAFVNIGLVPDGGSTAFLPARIGYARAAEMAMLGERVPATQALDWGLINRVVPDDELEGGRRCPARAARQRADRPPTRARSGCSTGGCTPTSPGSSTPRRRPSASRAKSKDFIEGVAGLRREAAAELHRYLVPSSGPVAGWDDVVAIGERLPGVEAGTLVGHAGPAGREREGEGQGLLPPAHRIRTRW